MVVGCIVEWEDRILLCKRGIEPRYGMWTVPAGFMENGETTFEGAVRETLEEANARVQIDSLYALYNIPHINQVYLLFRARLLDAQFKAGAETLEVRLFRESEIPWEEIAFASIDAPTTGSMLHSGTWSVGARARRKCFVHTVVVMATPKYPDRSLARIPLSQRMRTDQVGDICTLELDDSLPLEKIVVTSIR